MIAYPVSWLLIWLLMWWHLEGWLSCELLLISQRSEFFWAQHLVDDGGPGDAGTVTQCCLRVQHSHEIVDVRMMKCVMQRTQ
mmetsp:Transcript_17575/g.37962  ORF Transcript_17575/g.37962 Transcript_17575/m.37962 type:complete len:82 (+) Transcript_17575:1691-1936(+)